MVPSTAAAQAAADSVAAPLIRGIELTRQEIFDSAEADSWPERLANTLHIRTRPQVIRRELLFRDGDPYDSVLVAESARNLRALGIFRSVRIDSVRTDSGLVMQVATYDAWTTRPGGRLRTAGNQVSIGLSFYEDNFLGTATRAGASFSSDPIRTTFSLEAWQPRFLGSSVGVGARWEDRSDGTVLRGRVNRPFYSVSDARAFSVSAEYRDGTVNQYLDGIDVPTDTLANRMGAVRSGYAWAVQRTMHRYTRVGALAQVVRNNFQPASDTAPIPRTVTAAVGGFVEWSRVRYIARTGFQTFSRTEDIDLSTTLTLGLYAAPAFLGYDSAGVGLFAGFHIGAPFEGGFVSFDGIADGLITAAGIDSGGTVLNTTVAWNPDSNSQLVWHGSAGRLTDPAPGYEFDLGLNSGPRAFGVHSFTGNRAFFTTAEARRLLWPRMFGVLSVGVAAYVDYGGAWWSGSPVRTGTDVGVGLRLAQTRSSQGIVSRVDLSWRFANDAVGSGWVVSLGRGFVFSLNAQRPSQ
ncbi:MAG TPA: hypothetical protein VFV65_02710 [Gemmatimonadales bacterium]|nr:hypothetical protein [Gemmatimonadales bacterium]